MPCRPGSVSRRRRTYLDGVVGEVEEPEAHDVDGGGGPPGAGERAAVLLGVAEVAADVRREADHQHLAGAPTSQSVVSQLPKKKRRDMIAPGGR